MKERGKERKAGRGEGGRKEENQDRERGKRIKSVFEGISWGRREIKIEGVCWKEISMRKKNFCRENNRVRELGK